MNVLYREAHVEDAGQLSVLFKAVYIDTYGLEGVSREFSNFIMKRFHPDEIIRKINSEESKLFLATYDGNPIGALWIELNKECVLQDFKSAEINKLYVLRRFHGQGIGHELMRWGEEYLRKQNETNVWLITWQKNPGAIQFYEKENYQIIGTAPFVMEENTYTNVVMTKQL